MKQLRLDLDFDQKIHLQYRFPMANTELITDNAAKDSIKRRYHQLVSLDLPLLEPQYHVERTDLKDLEAGCRYYEIQDFYTKFNILRSVLVPADDVLLVESLTSASSISRWNNYNVCINWYIKSWGSVYHFYEDQEIVDQFRPEDFTLWALDLEQSYKTYNLDFSDKTRIHISWLYKDKTFNQVLADWTKHYK